MSDLTKELEQLIAVESVRRLSLNIEQQRQEEELMSSILNTGENQLQNTRIADVRVNRGLTSRVQEPDTPTPGPSTSAYTPRSQVGRGISRFNILAETRQHVKKFKIDGRRIVFSLVDPPKPSEAVTWFKKSIADVVNHVIENIPPSDQVGMTFRSIALGNNPAWFSFRRVDQLNINVLWEAISRILQSNTTIFSSGQFEIHMTHVRMPSGTGRARVNLMTFAEACHRKYGIVFIDNDDNLCLPRALVTAKAWVKNNPQFKNIVDNKDNLQTLKVAALLAKTKISIPPAGCGIPELVEFQRYYNKYNIVVYAYQSKGRNVIFEGAKGKNLPSLNLLYSENHFSTIKSLTAAFNCKYYCEPCHKPYESRAEHSCENLCPCCHRKPSCNPSTDAIFCNLCKRNFFGQLCFNNHTGKLCTTLRCCEICFKIYRRSNNNRVHVCNEIYCKLCNMFKPANHNCYIRPVANTASKKAERHLFIYFDFETRQETRVSEKDYLHEPNLCVIQQSCSDCETTEDLKLICTSCGVRQHVFSTNVIAQFISYFTLPRTSFSNITCIAHNGKAFDFQFVLKYLVEVKNFKPKLILQGTKIILIQIDIIRFIDSLNYLPMALSKLPKSFDLPQNLSKGYFPHFFNKLENQNYIGPMPAIEYYSPDTMHAGEYGVFMKWYNNQVAANYVFRMQSELISYCIADVTILRLACTKFRKEFIETCSVCPFTEATTIASACNRVFRKLFLERDTISIIPKHNYRFSDNYSKISIKWLLHEENVRGIVIKHAARGNEVKLDLNLKVDGFHEPDNHVFEFHGCYFHGHDLCFRTNRDTPLHGKTEDTMNTRYLRTLEKTRKLRSLGYTVTEMWECDFNAFLKRNKDVKEYVENHAFLKNTPLEPRDSFFGGRTGGTYLYYKACAGEQIRYVDVCSLYPWVSKYGKFPVGHPEILIGGECKKLVGNNFNLAAVEGLIKCAILPPTDLYHPVLPAKIHNKLMFALCRTCCETLAQADCNHTVQQRVFTGTWVVDEVKRAVSLGYIIQDIYEIWQYSVTRHDKNTKSDGLFSKYINMFLKIKQEATGYPSECNTDDAREKYINDYRENEGVSLDPNNISKNAGRRVLAKTMLNSFWGKFGQRENMPRTTVVSDEAALYDLLSNPAVNVNHIIPCGDNFVYVNWEYLMEVSDNLGTVNVIIAAYTTAHARLRLYDFLEPLGRRVLYYDTDSVIYTHRPNEYEPATGNFLGDLTCELQTYGAGSYITEFACGGPKNYAFKVLKQDGSTENVCKVKGVSLNYKNSKLINFNSIKEMILNDDTEPIIIAGNNIRRRPDHTVVTSLETKKYQITFMKRRRIGDYETEPYGYKKPRAN